MSGRSDVSSFAYRSDCASLMASASVSVIHGGHGTIYDVIGAGRPALVTPNNAEQKGNGRLLESLGISLLVTTYQAGKLMAVRGRNGRVDTLLRSFERPMGLAVREPWHASTQRSPSWRCPPTFTR